MCYFNPCAAKTVYIYTYLGIFRSNEMSKKLIKSPFVVDAYLIKKFYIKRGVFLYRYIYLLKLEIVSAISA